MRSIGRLRLAPRQASVREVGLKCAELTRSGVGVEQDVRPGARREDARRALVVPGWGTQRVGDRDALEAESLRAARPGRAGARAPSTTPLRSYAGNAAVDSITESRPRGIAALYGSSAASRWALVGRSLLSLKSVSMAAEPTPGKCLPHAAAPALCRPTANCVPYFATVAALNENARPWRQMNAPENVGTSSDRREVPVDPERLEVAAGRASLVVRDRAAPGGRDLGRREIRRTVCQAA